MKDEQKSFYITTTLPYVNADPHIGFALEIVQADVLARHAALCGASVFFNTGTDEHGTKIFDKAKSEGRDVQEYVDYYAGQVKQLKTGLNLFDDIHFIRTTDQKHIAAAQYFWNLCLKNGDIYKKAYKTRYCSGCELEKTDSELNEKGECSIHPGKPLQIIEEENYFFKYSKYQDALLTYFEANPDFIIPESRFNEIKKFVSGGLIDFSISRVKEKMPWGIPVPDDDTQVMYVWFDALVNYISTLDWPASADDSDGGFKRFWPGIQVAGKDQVRMQAGMWQAMLCSAGLPFSKQIYFHGFINVDGQKMSKSIGNVINPFDLIQEFGTDPLRYFLLREIHPYEDGDFTMQKFKDAYNSHLANGLGNLTSRILKMALSYNVSFDSIKENANSLFDQISEPLSKYDFAAAINIVWKRIGDLDVFIQEQAPFKKIKVDEEGAKKDVAYLLAELNKIAIALGPFLPETSEKILTLLSERKFPEVPLFARKD